MEKNRSLVLNWQEGYGFLRFQAVELLLEAFNAAK